LFLKYHAKIVALAGQPCLTPAAPKNANNIFVANESKFDKDDYEEQQPKENTTGNANGSDSDSGSESEDEQRDVIGAEETKYQEYKQVIQNLVDKHLDYPESIIVDGAGPIPDHDLIISGDDIGHERDYLVQCELWNEQKRVEVYVFPQKRLKDTKRIFPLDLELHPNNEKLLKKFIEQTLFDSGLCIAKGYWNSDGRVELNGMKGTKMLSKLKQQLQLQGGKFASK
jgi:hypothetical protein